MKIKFNLKHCYGIGKLDKEFIFDEDKPIIIHSSNGTMKTSLCKTLLDIQNNTLTIDQIHPSNLTLRDVKVNDIDAISEDFLVFNSFEDSYISQSLSKIILENTLKKKYDFITKDQIIAENQLITKVSRSIGQKFEKTKTLFLNTFKSNTFTDSVIKALKIKKSSLRLSSLKGLKYKQLFDKPIRKVLDDDGIRKSLKSYNSQYQRMLKKSLIFTSGVFEISNLNNIAVSLASENYFKGKNKLLINNHSIPIESEEQLINLMNDELSKIDSDKKVQESFKVIIDKCGSQKNLSGFFETIKKDKVLSKQFTDIDRLERSFLCFNLLQFPDELHLLTTKFKANKVALKQLINQANKEILEWEKVIEIFKTRFRVPYDIKIKNQTNSMLGISEPIIEFTYENMLIEETSMIRNVLSSSEKRAYYILQVLFEIERYKSESKSKIIVFDDIADSFDYTNKYAIIEYLSELSSNTNFSLIVLTHNFDFYRSFGLKVASRSNCYFALKDASTIIIHEGEYLENLFQYYKNKIGKKNTIDLTVIGFARNLIEYYTDNYLSDSKYQFYTKLLHYRPHSTNVRMGTLYSHYNSQFKKAIPKPSSNISVYKKIIAEADVISLSNIISHKVEEKVVISLALRIRCEKYIYNRIKKVDSTIKNRIDTLQLGELIEEYKVHFFHRQDIINIAKQISIVSPYHIHINSFMIEPMVDVSLNNLRDLYKRAKKILGKF